MIVDDLISRSLNIVFLFSHLFAASQTVELVAGLAVLNTFLFLFFSVIVHSLLIKISIKSTCTTNRISSFSVYEHHILHQQSLHLLRRLIVRNYCIFGQV